VECAVSSPGPGEKIILNQFDRTDT